MLNLNSKTIQLHTGTYTVNREKAVSYSDLRICFVKSGSATWIIDSEKYKVSRNDIIFFSHKQKRALLDISSDGLQVCVIRLNRQAFLNTAHLSFFLNFIKEKKFLIHNQALLSLLIDIESEYNRKDTNHYEMMSAKLTEFFVILERTFELKPIKYIKIDKNMIKALDYIDSHISEKITLKDVAKIANMTETSFSRLFSSANGISFKKYVMSKKIEYAISLLESTDRNVIDIAFECGFSSISGFYDTFRKVTGTTPNKISGLI